MNTIILFLLISVSDGAYNRGNITVVERFTTAQDCENVRAALKKFEENAPAVCVQAKVFFKAAP